VCSLKQVRGRCGGVRGVCCERSDDERRRRSRPWPPTDGAGVFAGCCFDMRGMVMGSKCVKSRCKSGERFDVHSRFGAIDY
jgi:hypothetical protein